MRQFPVLAILATILISCQPEAPKPEVHRSLEVAIAPTPTQTPERTPVEPTATPLLTPTPTMEWADVWATQGVDVTAKKTVRRCLHYAPLVDRWNPDFQLDPALVFAVMAQESACLTNNDDGVSVGLMAVTPATWTTSRDRLKDPAVNIFWGMKILWLTLNNEEHNPDHDIRTALAAYNCGWVSLEAGKCFDFGGYAYADKVLHFWLPYVQGALVKP